MAVGQFKAVGFCKLNELTHFNSVHGIFTVTHTGITNRHECNFCFVKCIYTKISLYNVTGC